jgi:hypothetical protein
MFGHGCDSRNEDKQRQCEVVYLTCNAIIHQ